MTIRLEGGGAAPEDQIRASELNLGQKISGPFRSFLQLHDGAKPESNIFQIGTSNSAGIDRFIPLSDILKERSCIENLPATAYPVAWVSGGNYVYIDEAKNGAVYFWDHEEPWNICNLAPSFSEFLELLRPFDEASVQLKPGQVKRAWVDPEFLKRLKKK